jgi:hypothetical protein
MRYFEFGIIAVLIVGVFLVLAFGFNPSDAPNADNVAIATPASTHGSDCGDCTKEPVLSASLDFTGNSEYALDCGKIVVNGKSVNVYSGDTLVGTFNLSSSGKIVPAGSQPNGNIVKSAYSGPPGDTRSTYRVYPASFASDKNANAYLAVDFSNGTATVTPGNDVGRTHAKSERNTVGYGGSVADAAGCSSSSSGGG